MVLFDLSRKGKEADKKHKALLLSRYGRQFLFYFTIRPYGQIWAIIADEKQKVNRRYL